MINIRSASIGDFEKVLILVRKATQDMEARGIHQWDDLYPDESTLRADIDQKYMYVAEIDGCTAGMIVLNEDQPREYGDIRWQYSGRAMVVHRLTIDPKYQRQKIATQLMIFAEQLAAEVD